MKLTHSEIETLLMWCHNRNHLKHEFPAEYIDQLLAAKRAFPKGQGVERICEWWKEEVEIDIPPELVPRIVRAMVDNTSMEDSRLPWKLCDNLKAGAKP